MKAVIRPVRGYAREEWPRRVLFEREHGATSSPTNEHPTHAENPVSGPRRHRWRSLRVKSHRKYPTSSVPIARSDAPSTLMPRGDDQFAADPLNGRLACSAFDRDRRALGNCLAHRRINPIGAQRSALGERNLDSTIFLAAIRIIRAIGLVVRRHRILGAKSLGREGSRTEMPLAMEPAFHGGGALFR